MGLQVRLWLTVVMIVVAGALVFVLGTAKLFDQVVVPLESVSLHSAQAVSGALARRSSDSVDAAARASVDDQVRSALKKGAMTPEAEATLLARGGLELAPSFAFLVRADGTVAAKAGTDPALDAKLAGHPLVAEPLTGLARDGLMVTGGASFHVAAAPIYDGGAAPIGVAVLGWPYDGAFADKLSQAVDANVVLLADGGRQGTRLPELAADQLKVRAAAFGDASFALSLTPRTFPLLLPDHGRYVATGIPLFGSENSAELVVVTDRNDALNSLATAQLLIIGGTVVLALLQIVLIVSTLAAIRKPVDVIIEHLSQFQQGGSVGILPETALTGPFLRLGKQVNMILQLMPSTSRPSNNALGSLPLSQPPPSLPADDDGPPSTIPRAGGFQNVPRTGQANPIGTPPPAPGAAGALGKARSGGFAATPTTSAQAVKQAAPNVAGAASAPLSDGGMLDAAFGGAAAASSPPARAPAAPSASLEASAISGLFNDNAPDPLAAFRVASARPPDPPPAESHGHDATLMFQVPKELLKQSAQEHSGGGPAVGARGTPDDARTVVAQVPHELLASVGGGAAVSEDEAHYRDVYAQFVQTRQHCGEDTSDLTYDRFVAKLLKNRQQIIEKHKARSVRFQVYVKEGKAALRALPVRD